MERDTIRRIREAVDSGRLPAIFGPAEVNKVLSIHWAGTFLPKHRAGNPGGYTELFVRVEPGRYRLKYPEKRVLSRHYPLHANQHYHAARLATTRWTRSKVQLKHARVSVHVSSELRSLPRRQGFSGKSTNGVGTLRNELNEPEGMIPTS
jgi:hypothetical protein